MKTKEIEGWNKGVKITWKNAYKGQYVYLCQDYFIWKDEHGDHTHPNDVDLETADDFLPYKEPAKAVRYWLWIVDNKGWYRTNGYINQDGKATNGDRVDLSIEKNWHGIEKYKTNEYIDVLDGKIVAINGEEV